MVPIKVLLVDDEAAFLRVTSNRLEVRGYRVVTAESGAEALRVLEEVNDLDVMVLDLKMPGLYGLDVLRRVKEVDPLLEVILLTGHATVATGIEGIKLGLLTICSNPARWRCWLKKSTRPAPANAKMRTCWWRPGPPGLRPAGIWNPNFRLK